MIQKNKWFRIFTNKQGQGTIEALALSVTVIAAVTALGAGIYFSVVHVGMNYMLHEYLICQKTQGATDCKKDFYKKSAPFLVAAKVLTLESSVVFRKQRARLVVAMPMKRTLTFKKELEIY
ncbi:hypothetical protein [Bdellovibrio sp. HCB337]|uniref:hypothetical protein n=1 Tax=Bdellovibrio sp. HCB337 TaxID=3394358 RepID=UPI0039A43F9B